MRLLSRPPRKALAIYSFYLGIAILITWPLVTVMSSEIVGDSTSDSYEMLRLLWWFQHALKTGQSPFFQPLMAYPDGLSSISMWSAPLQFFPAWLFALVMPVSVAYNLTVLLTLALNGWALYRLAYYLLNEQDAPALLAGVVFTAFPAFQGQILGGHPGLIVLWPVPLYLLALLRLCEYPTRRHYALAILSFVLSSGGHPQMVIYVLMPITGLFLLGRLLGHEWTNASRLLVVSALGITGALIFVLPVIDQTLAAPTLLDLDANVRYSADLLGVVSPSFRHPVFAALDYPRQVLGVNLVEGSAYVGMIVAILIIIAIWRQRAARWWLGLAVTTWLLSLGPLLKLYDTPVIIQSGGFETTITLPWAFLQNLPGLDLVRSPGRFSLGLAVAVAVLAGYGAAYLWKRFDRMRWRQIALVLIMGGIIWEYQFFWPMPTIPAEVPAPIATLRERDDLRAVFNIPFEHLLAAKDALYLQTGHQKPMIAGQVTRETPVSPARLSILQATLDPTLLDRAGVDVVILHRRRAAEIDLLDSLTERARQQLGDPVFQDDRFAVFNVPDSDSVPDFTTLAFNQPDTDDRAVSSLYTPQAGWVDFSGRLEANNRAVELYLDDQRVHTWIVDGIQEFSIPLRLTEAGYHSVSLALDPPCPPNIINPTLQCRSLTLHDLNFVPLTVVGFGDPVRFDRGLTLAGVVLPEMSGSAITVRLWWQFEQALHENEIRFVHVLNSDGNPVAQDDTALGAQAAGSAWTETVTLVLPEDLPPGAYRVTTGWYSYPDLTRFDVLAAVPGAENNTVEVGIVTINP